ncbi:hypothetical protein MTR72_00120 [Bradyrhizobium sp. ISRA442]|uniref:hypothetical protein n=1 Tax=Bradyrhizobium sp. ISRA442 TaxID=2866197 RepID=UPI00311AFF7A
MSSGPVEWCIDIAIIAAICIGIFMGAHARFTASDHGFRRAPSDPAACFQRPATSADIGALPQGKHPV